METSKVALAVCREELGLTEEEVASLNTYISDWVGRPCEIDMNEIENVNFNFQLTSDEADDSKQNAIRFCDIAQDFMLIVVDSKSFPEHVRWICHRIMDQKILDPKGFAGVLIRIDEAGNFVRWAQAI